MMVTIHLFVGIVPRKRLLFVAMLLFATALAGKPWAAPPSASQPSTHQAVPASQPVSFKKTKTLSVLLTQLRQADWQVRYHALQRLSRFPPTPTIVSAFFKVYRTSLIDYDYFSKEENIIRNFITEQFENIPKHIIIPASRDDRRERYHEIQRLSHLPPTPTIAFTLLQNYRAALRYIDYQENEWSQNELSQYNDYHPEDCLRQVIRQQLKKIPANIFIPISIQLLRYPGRDSATAFLEHEIIRQIERLGSSALPFLLLALKHPALEVQIVAIWLIGWIGPQAIRGVPVILPLLKHHHERIRWHAALALGNIKAVSAIPSLINTLHKDRDARVRREAAASLGRMGPQNREVIPALIQAVRSDQNGSAVEALGKMGVAAIRAIPVLLQAIQNPRHSEHRFAVEAIGRIASMPAHCIPVLINLLQEHRLQDYWLQHALIEALPRFGASAVPFLLQTLRHKHPTVRAAAAKILGKIGVAANKAIPHLIQRLRDPDWSVRENAAQALGLMGSAAVAAVPILLQWLRNHRSDIRATAIDTLALIKPQQIDLAQTFIRFLSDKNDYVRESTAYALGALGPRAVDAIPQLHKLILFDPKPQPKFAAIRALRQIGSPEPRTLRILLSMLLVAPTCHVREEAAAAIESLGLKGLPAVPSLFLALQNRCWGVRRAAAGLLSKIQPHDPKIINALYTLLRDPQFDVRMYVQSLPMVQRALQKRRSSSPKQPCNF